MIDKNKTGSVDPDGKKKKKKKKRPVEAGAAPAAAPATDKKKIKKSAGPRSAQMFRDGSMVGQLYDRLKSGKPVKHEDLFKGLDSSDEHRLLTDLRNKGKKTGEFTIERPEAGVLKLVESK